MNLESKNIRDGLGIDTFERAIVYATWLIKSELILKSNQNPTAVQTTFLLSENQYFVSCSNLLFFDSLSALSSGYLFQNTLPLEQGSPTWIGAVATPTENISYALPTEPPLVNTLEKYLAWASISLIGYLGLQEKLNLQSNNFRFFADADTPYISLLNTIDFNYPQYCLDSNLLQNVKPTLLNLEGFEPSPPIVNSLIGNDFIFGNNSRIGN